MRCRSVSRALPLIILASAALAACEQPIAVRGSPQPVQDAEIATAAAMPPANPAGVARARAMLDAAVREYNRPGSSYRAILDQVAEKTQRLAIKHSSR
jgi:hypothetical protein